MKAVYFKYNSVFAVLAFLCLLIKTSQLYLLNFCSLWRPIQWRSRILSLGRKHKGAAAASHVTWDSGAWRLSFESRSGLWS